MKWISDRDVMAGAMFLGIGLLFTTVASGYNMGRISRIGPGFFPFWTGVLLTGTGVLVTIRALVSLSHADRRISSFAAAKVGLVLGSVALFALLLIPLGLVLTMVLTIFVASLASSEFSIRGTALTTLILVALNVVIFAVILDLRLPLWRATRMPLPVSTPL